MLRLPTVLLRHETACGSHYDWLLGDPRLGRETRPCLWSARTAYDSSAWLGLGTWPLWRMAPHRSYYLNYQGPLAPRFGQRRGRVERVDRGSLVARLWTDRRMVADVSMARFEAAVEIRFVNQDRWLARVL